jgi:hypothetical protein
MSIKRALVPSKDFCPFYGEKVTWIEARAGHVRKGYSFTDLEQKLSKVGLEIVVRDSCGGFLTQKRLALSRFLSDKLAKKVYVHVYYSPLIETFDLP